MLKKFPKRIEIELVSDCNLRCVYCPRHYVNDLKGYMDFELYKKIIDEIREFNPILVLHRRGESLLHPKFNEMLNYLNNDFKEIQIATNATYLNEDKFKAIVNNITFISFSLDTEKSFNKTRIPANYDVVKKKILKFLDYNQGRVTTQVSMVNVGQPKEEIEEFKNFWIKKVDRVRIYESHSTNGEFGALKNPRKERKACIMPFYQMTIYENGIVARCNHDWDSDGMGDVKKNSIKEIFNNQKYKDLRKQHTSLNISDKVCKNCDSWYPEEKNQGTGEIIE
jgi:radical SAM protein with 4Fe4S-binding SPASM domain